MSEAERRAAADAELAKQISSVEGERRAAIKPMEGWEIDHLRRAAEHHRRQAFEIAQNLPVEMERAKAILDDALRFHALIHDEGASSVSGDLARLVGE